MGCNGETWGGGEHLYGMQWGDLGGGQGEHLYGMQWGDLGGGAPVWDAMGRPGGGGHLYGMQWGDLGGGGTPTGRDAFTPTG